MADINELYLKISYKSRNKDTADKNICKLNFRMELDEKHHKVCGGMLSRNSCTIIFKVSDIEEAVDVVKKAYITGSDTYKYEINYKLLAV